MGDDNLNTSRFTKPALEMTRLEAYTMVAMHAILLGEGGGNYPPRKSERTLLPWPRHPCRLPLTLWMNSRMKLPLRHSERGVVTP